MDWGSMGNDSWGMSIAVVGWGDIGSWGVGVAVVSWGSISGIWVGGVSVSSISQWLSIGGGVGLDDGVTSVWDVRTFSNGEDGQDDCGKALHVDCFKVCWSTGMNC
jgi:hypothetical protein